MTRMVDISKQGHGAGVIRCGQYHGLGIYAFRVPTFGKTQTQNQPPSLLLPIQFHFTVLSSLFHCLPSLFLSPSFIDLM